MKLIRVLITIFIVIANFTVYAQTNEKPEVNVIAKVKANDGRLENVAKVIVEEHLFTKYYTLLNYIFFEENSSEMSARYRKINKEQAEHFIPEQTFLNYEVLDVYYDVLNIIGLRLKKNPDERIQLVGYNSNTGTEKGNINLSKKRAETITNYLNQVWGIKHERLVMKSAGNLPERSSRLDDENRRVEIIGDYKILGPLVVNDTSKDANPPEIVFRTNVKCSYDINEWNLNVRQGKRELKEFRGKNKPPFEINWRIKSKSRNAEKEMPKGNLKIIYNLDVDTKVLATSPNMSLPVKELTIQYKKKHKLMNREYSRYNLILFDFNSEELNVNNLNILKYIKSQEEINKDTKLYISGYTDTSGSPDHNLVLSKKRAEQTSSKLLELGIPSTRQIVEGQGSSDNPYYKSVIEKLIVREGAYVDPDKEFDYKTNTVNFNDSPEGRFYCRTVVIEIEKVPEQK